MFSLNKDTGETEKFLQKIIDGQIFDLLDAYGAKGVAALSAATPKDSGKTASSWSYKKVKTGTGYSLEFHNTYINDGVNIAVILQYGHGTGTGGYVQGIDYINPAVQPIFIEIAEALTKEVS